MLKIYYNEKSNADISVTLTIKDVYCKAEITDNNNENSGTDVIDSMLPYNSYAMIFKKGKVKIYRKISSSDYKFLDLNRLGVAIKMDFADICELYGTQNVLQIDTGIMASDERDIVVRIFMGNKDKITIDADQEYELLPFNSDDLVLGDHPRVSLWDSYSLTANGAEFMSNRKGTPVSGEFDEPIIKPAAQDYVEFTITKYKGSFTEKLARDIDDEEVFVESSIGIVDNRRVRLENGVGRFKLFTLGYAGVFKIKLGRKWYEVWNDYSLILENE